MLTVDSREQNKTLLDAADCIRLLEYPNPTGGPPLSYDIEVTTRSGTVLRFERKTASDALSSWKAGKLDRQASAADALIIEWSMSAVGEDLGRMRTYEDEQALRRDYDNLELHIARLALSMPVIMRTNVQHTIDTLRYFERHESLAVFTNSVKVHAPTLRERLVRSLSPSITPEAFRAIWPTVDREALIAALGVASWPINPTVRKRILKDLCQP